MPYIKNKETRKFIDDYVITFLSNETSILGDLAVSFSSHFNFVGNLNYFLFKLAKNTMIPNYTYFYYFISALVKINCKCYADYQSFMGELFCAKKEIQRRLGKDNSIAKYLEKSMNLAYDEITAPYEDKKIKENGDVE